MMGDVRAVKELGFDGLKLDSCGPSQHLAEWSELLNKSGWWVPFPVTIIYPRAAPTPH